MMLAMTTTVLYSVILLPAYERISDSIKPEKIPLIIVILLLSAVYDTILSSFSFVRIFNLLRYISLSTFSFLIVFSTVLTFAPTSLQMFNNFKDKDIAVSFACFSTTKFISCSLPLLETFFTKKKIHSLRSFA